jgi:hypothetical protein
LSAGEVKKMESEEYEQLISNISQELTNDTRLRSIGRKKFGKTNLWEGVSGFHHQIDVLIDNDSDVLLIECKAWKYAVDASVFLTFWARLLEIKENPKNKNLNIKGAIVTTKGWQSGVEKLVKYYAEICSGFVVNEEIEVVKVVHTHFIKASSIPSGEVFEQPTILQSKPQT